MRVFAEHLPSDGGSDLLARFGRAVAVLLVICALAIGVIFVVHRLAGGSSRDAQVTSDLVGLLLSKGVDPGPVTCTHQAGDQFSCAVTIAGRQQFAQVTDDGHSIVEQGIAP